MINIFVRKRINKGKMLALHLFHSLLFTGLVLSRHDTAMLKLIRTLAKTRRINAHRKLAGDSLEARRGNH